MAFGEEQVERESKLWLSDAKSKPASIKQDFEVLFMASELF